VSGWVGDLFAALGNFDKPFNQAPSLHVGLAVILWVRFRAHTAGALRIMLAAYFVLLAASTLTTYQHLSSTCRRARGLDFWCWRLCRSGGWPIRRSH
jgi:hypothetical protein